MIYNYDFDFFQCSFFQTLIIRNAPKHNFSEINSNVSQVSTHSVYLLIASRHRIRV